MSEISLDNVRNTYRFYAPLYDRLFGAAFEPGRVALGEAVSALRPTSILEVGVGTGLILERYPSTSAITGIDISREMLDIAHERAAKLKHHNIQLAAMDAEKMDFPDGSFDCVAMPYVLSVTPNPQQLIAEIRRVCKKGGTILILNHFSGSRYWWFLERTVRSMANKIGFRSDFCYNEQILKHDLISQSCLRICYNEQILKHDWEIKSVKKVNFLGLSKLVEIRNVWLAAPLHAPAITLPDTELQRCGQESQAQGNAME